MPDYTNPPQPPKGAVPIQKGSIPPPPAGATPISRIQQPFTPSTSVERQAGSEKPFAPWAEKGLEFGEKYLVDPFEKVAQWGQKMGAEGYLGIGGFPESEIQKSPTWMQPIEGGLRGVGGALGGQVTDPRMWPFMAESVGAGLVSPMLSKAAGLGFRGQMAYGAGEGAHNLYKNWNQMSPAQRGEGVVSTALQAGMAGHGLPGEIRGETPPPPAGAVPIDSTGPEYGTGQFGEGNKYPKEPAGPNVGREGQSKPTMDAAAQMGGGLVDEGKASVAQAAPESTSGATSPVEPVKENLSTGTANDRPQVQFKPSEKASTMSAPRKIIPEAEQMAFQEKTQRLRDVIKNPKATPEEHEMAAQKLGQMETIRQGYLGSAVSPEEQRGSVQPSQPPTSAPQPKPNMRTDPKGLDDLLNRQVDKGQIDNREKTDISNRAGLRPAEDPEIKRARERYEKDLAQRQPQIDAERAKVVAADAAKRKALQARQPAVKAEIEQKLKEAKGEATKESVPIPQAKTPTSGRPPEAPTATTTTEPVRESEQVAKRPTMNYEDARRMLGAEKGPRMTTGEKVDDIEALRAKEGKGEDAPWLAKRSEKLQARAAEEAKPVQGRRIAGEELPPPASPEEQERQRLLKRIQELSEPPKAPEGATPTSKPKSKTQRALENAPVGDASKALDKRTGRPVEPRTEPTKPGDVIRNRGGLNRRSMLSDKPLFEDKKPSGGSDFDKLRERVRQVGGSEEVINAIVEAADKKGGTAKERMDRAMEELRNYGSRVWKEQSAKGEKPNEGEKGFFSFGGVKHTPHKSVVGLIRDEASRVAESRRLADGIDDLSSMRQADVIRAKTAMEKVPGTRADHEAIYHWLEDKSLPLTQTQTDIVGKHLLPIMAENSRIAQKLKGAGLPVQDYVHRIPTKKYSAAERILLGRKQMGGPVLSQSASALKGRKYEAMVDKSTGKRLVVSEKGDKIQVHWNNQVTDMGVTRETAEKAGFEFKTATTKEIEQHTPTQYLKHGFGNTLLSYMELKNAERAHDFIEAYTKTADFKSATMKVGSGNPPKGWRQVYGLKPLEGHYFEPHSAEVIQRYVDKLSAGDTGAFEKLNSFLRTSIFFNPMIHVPNITAHWVVEKGTRGWMPDNYPRILRTSAKAIDILMHPERESVGGKPSYLDFLDKGAPLQGQRKTTKEATALLTSKMFTEFQQKPGLAKKVSDALGFAHPVNMVKALYDFSSKATWVVDDFARIQATLERMDREGLDSKTAMTDVSRHIPNYRLPTRIFDNRFLGKIMENPMVSMFGAYHYGALKSYGEMMKEVGFGSGAEKVKSFNRMAMLGLLATVIYPALDQLAKKGTGDEKARVRRAGAATFPDTINRLAHGKTSLWNAATSVVTPAPLVSIAKDLAVAGMKPKPIGQQLEAFGKSVYSKLGPVSALNQARGKGQKGPIDWKKFFWSMLGVRHDSSGEKPQKGLSLGKMSLGKL